MVLELTKRAVVLLSILFLMIIVFFAMVSSGGPSQYNILGKQKSETDHQVILVTGATGLVGRALQTVVSHVRRPQEEWVFVSSNDADLRDKSKTFALFKKHKPTHIIHLAAFVGGVYMNMEFPADFWSFNININGNIVEASHKFGVKKLISCLSTCIFPDDTTYPIDETMIHNGPPHPSNEGYAYAKRMVDVMNRCYHKQHGSNFTSVIPTNIYGPHDNYHLAHAHVIPGLIHKFYNAKKTNEPVVIWGSGRSLRQFIYSPDLARLIVWVLRNYHSPEPIILSPGEEEEVSIRYVVELIRDAIGFEGEIRFDTEKPEGQFKKTASNAKLKKLYPNFKFTAIEQGIAETVQWFIDNFETCRK